MNCNLTSDTFVSGNSSTLASDDSLLFVDETSHTSGDYFDETLLHQESEANNETATSSTLSSSLIELNESSSSLIFGNQNLQAQSEVNDISYDSSTLDLLSNSSLNLSTQTASSVVCYSPSPSIDNYVLVDSPVNHSTPNRRNHKRKRCNMESPVSRHSITSADLLSTSCCKRKCLSNLSLVEVTQSRERFSLKNTTEQNQFLLDSFQISGGRNASSDGELMGMIEGKLLCCNAFTSVLSVSQKRYKQLHDQFKEGAIKFLRKPVNRVESTKVSEAKAWMSRFFCQIGDRMPHIQQIHLPHFLTKHDVYARMKKELAEQGMDEKKCVSLSWFYKLWDKSFRHVVIPEQSRFSKCDLCCKFAQERMKLGAAAFQEYFQKHLQIISQERKKYYLHKEKARSQPEKYVTIIIDGMDQNKTNVPALVQETKSTQNLYRVRTHLTGALVHTRSPHGKLIYSFYDILQWPHDSNLTIQVLGTVLSKISDSAPLPPVLYLQLDNTSRENKNRYVLGFCSLLVKKGIFKKVRINFLPVGHTHEDVDQFFSKVSHKLKKNNIETIQDLIKFTKESTSPEPTVVTLSSVHDVKTWITPFLNPFTGHSTPHCFKIIKDAEGEVKIYYKCWSSDPWCKEDEVILPLNDMPSGEPPILPPTADKIEVNKLRDDIPKFKQWISPSSSDAWDVFLERELDDLLSTHEAAWAMQAIWNSVEHPERPSTIPEPQHEVDPSLMSMIEATLNPPCRMYNGTYRSKQHAVQAVSDTSLVEIGHLVAVDCENCDKEPLLGKVLKVLNEEVEIVWLEGEYSKSWRVAKQRDPRNKRKMVDWTDTIPKASIILFDFELTTTNHLRKRSIEHLKKAYAEIRSRNH